MWWTVAKEAATNWSGHKDARGAALAYYSVFSLGPIIVIAIAIAGWRDVWLGAFITALFFEVGKAAIGFDIGKQGLESTYGAAASIVVVLIWVYYTSQIILTGAEVTQAYAGVQ
jgi:uncharacterized BrkB/YihY/UPF0761 family membrane protein